MDNLPLLANKIRIDIIKMLSAAGSGHPGGALGMSDIFALLYSEVLNHDPTNPVWEERDRLILSNGHIVPVRYASMAETGYFDPKELKTLRKLSSPLQGHPERLKLKGLETTSGPLGSGLAQAVGIAVGAKLDNKRFRVYCVLSDGEHDEGNTWESILFAAKYKLSNLTCIVDRNNIQISGKTENIMPLDSLAEKYKAFNWHVVIVDGHDFNDIRRGLREARDIYDKPTVIIANTIPGRGVSFMEGKYIWHGKAPNKEESALALKELEAKEKEIKEREKNA